MSSLLLFRLLKLSFILLTFRSLCLFLFMTILPTNCDHFPLLVPNSHLVTLGTLSGSRVSNGHMSTPGMTWDILLTLRGTKVIYLDYVGTLRPSKSSGVGGLGGP